LEKYFLNESDWPPALAKLKENYELAMATEALGLAISFLEDTLLAE